MHTFLITMQSNPMTLTMTGHARKRIYQRSIDEPELVLVELAKILEQPEIADYLMNEVRIGEKVIIFDEDNCRSLALEMDTAEIRVCTVFYTTKDCRVRAGKDEPCIVVKNAVLHGAGMFGSMRYIFASAAIIG